MESSANIGQIKDEVAVKRHKEWQEANENTIISPGDYVKKAFKQDLTLEMVMYNMAHGGSNKEQLVEHMWVFVIKGTFNKGKITGRLDNDPMLVTNYKCGQLVDLDYSEIEEHM